MSDSIYPWVYQWSSEGGTAGIHVTKKTKKEKEKGCNFCVLIDIIIKKSIEIWERYTQTGFHGSMGRNQYGSWTGPLYQVEPKLNSAFGPVHELEPKLGSKSNFLIGSKPLNSQRIGYPFASLYVADSSIVETILWQQRWWIIYFYISWVKWWSSLWLGVKFCHDFERLGGGPSMDL